MAGVRKGKAAVSILLSLVLSFWCVPAQAFAAGNDMAGSGSAVEGFTVEGSAVDEGDATAALSEEAKDSEAAGDVDDASALAHADWLLGATEDRGPASSGSEEASAQVDLASSVQPQANQAEAEAVAFAASSGESAPGVLTEGWTQVDTCEYRIDEDGCLTLRPLGGASEAELTNLGRWESLNPKSFKIEGKISLVEDSAGEYPSVKEAFYQCRDLRLVDLSGLETNQAVCAEGMFGLCSALETAVLPETFKVSSIAYMFYCCKSLQTVDLGCLESPVPVGAQYMFYDCPALQQVAMPDLLEISSAANMFQNCEQISELDLSFLRTDDAVDAAYMFYECQALETVKLPQYFSISSVEFMFCRCAELKTVDLTGMETPDAVNANGLFAECTALESVALPDCFKVSALGDGRGGVQDGGMFYGCSGLKAIDLSSFETPQVVDAGQMFIACSSLETVKLPKDFKASSTKMMFQGCTNLQVADISGLDSAEPACMDSMFSGCSSLKTVAMPESFKSSGLWGMFSKCSALEAIDLSGLESSGEPSCERVFYGCAALASVKLPSSNFATTSMEKAFYGCKSLVSLDLSGLSSLGNVDASELFYGCSSLAEVIMPSNFSVSAVSAMFNRCSELIAADLSGLSTSTEVDASQMFADCFALNSVSLPSAGFKVSSLDKAFYYCRALSSLDLSGIETTAGIDADDAFYYCEALKSIIFPSEAFKVCSVDNMFSDCSALTSLDVSGMETPESVDASSMFTYCSSLESIELPRSFKVSSLGGGSYGADYAGSGMFYECKSLKAVDISGIETPEAVNASQLFRGCSGLERVVFPESFKVSAVTYMFDGCRLLTSLDLSGFDTSALEEARGFFVGAGVNTIAIGRNFSFFGVGEARLFSFPEYTGDYTGRWVSSVDGVAYAAGEIPDKVAAVYTAQKELSGSLFSVDTSTEIYSGKPLEKDINTVLVFGVDYAVDFEDNINVGEAKVVISGLGSYASQTLNYAFQIAKAPAEYDVPTGLTATYGQTLADIALPDGFTWQDDGSTTVGNAGENVFKAAYTPSDVANYEIANDIPVIVTVGPAKVDAPTAVGGLVYNGGVQAGVVADVRGLYSVEGGEQVDAGSYTAIAALADKANYVWADGSAEDKRVDWSMAKAPAEYDAPTGLVATYGQTLADVALPVGFSWDDPSASVGDPGDNLFSCSWSGDANHEGASGIQASVRVTREVDSSMFQLASTDFVYTGNAIEPVVSSAIVPEGSYAVSYRDNVDVGSATVTITGTGYWTGSCELRFQIAEQSVKGTVNESEPNDTLATADDFGTLLDIREDGSPLNYAYGTFGGSGKSVDEDTDCYSFTLEAESYVIFKFNSEDAHVKYVFLDSDGKPIKNPGGVNIEGETTEADATVEGGVLQPGKYYVKLSTSQDLSSEIAYTLGIRKKEVWDYYEVPKDLAATYGQTLADVELPEGFSWGNPTQTVGEPGENKFKLSYSPEGSSLSETGTASVKVTRGVDASMFQLSATSFTYTGKAVEPTVTSVIVPEGSYSVVYRDNVEVGTAAAIITGTGYWTGSCELEFEIAVAETPAAEIVAKGSFGTGVTWTLYDSGLLKIDGAGAVSMSGTKPPYSKYASQVKAIEIGEGITSICGFAFSGCSNLQGIFFHCKKTSGYQGFFKQYAFSGVDSSVVLYYTPGDETWANSSEAGRKQKPWVEGMLDIDWSHNVEFGACGDSAFWTLDDSGCLTIKGSGDVSSCVSPLDVSSVKELSIEGEISSISYRLSFGNSTGSGYSNLEKVSITAPLATFPERMFVSSTALKQVELPSALTSVPSQAFDGCCLLESVKGLSGVEIIGSEAFRNCTNLKTIDLGAGLTSVGEKSFSGCTAFAPSSLPESVTLIGEYAFSETGISEMTLPASLTSMGYTAFNGCANLERLIFLGRLPSFTGSDNYKGNDIEAVHASADETWNSCKKYYFNGTTESDGVVTWYAQKANGELVEDDYISSYDTDEIAPDSGGSCYFTQTSGHAFTFSLEHESVVKLDWLTVMGGCVHNSFLITLKSTKGNNGSKIDSWIVNHNDDGYQAKNMTLDAGSYVVEVHYSDSHSSHSASISIGYTAQDASVQTVYRMYNPITSEHLFTTDKSEYQSLTKHNWKQEGEAWTAPKSGAVGVYRLYNPGLGALAKMSHHYTTDRAEAENLVRNHGWVYDFGGQPAFYSAEDSAGALDGASAVYRLYNGGLSAHHYTLDSSENGSLIKRYGWKGEGTGFYAYSVS